jgi:hypothetical protein
MTFREAYIIFGIPLIALAMAGGALWLTTWSSKKLDREQAEAGE